LTIDIGATHKGHMTHIQLYDEPI